MAGMRICTKSKAVFLIKGLRGKVSTPNWGGAVSPSGGIQVSWVLFMGGKVQSGIDKWLGTGSAVFCTSLLW